MTLKTLFIYIIYLLTRFLWPYLSATFLSAFDILFIGNVSPVLIYFFHINCSKRQEIISHQLLEVKDDFIQDKMVCVDLLVNLTCICQIFIT